MKILTESEIVFAADWIARVVGEVTPHTIINLLLAWACVVIAVMALELSGAFERETK